MFILGLRGQAARRKGEAAFGGVVAGILQLFRIRYPVPLVHAQNICFSLSLCLRLERETGQNCAGFGQQSYLIESNDSLCSTITISMKFYNDFVS